jgi:benzoylformate decarboxylase
MTPSTPPVRALLQVLADEGVDRVFGNPGTTELPMLAALSGAPGIEYVLGLHESSVVAMADGYARATGRPAVVNLHIAAGLANGLVGLLNASRSRVPLVVTAGQQDRRHLVEDPMLSGDLVGLARPAVKSAVEVQHARDLPVQLRRAFRLAVTPPAGPVFLAIPMDLLDEDGEIDLPPRALVPPPGPAPALADAAAILTAARRPVIVAGDGVGREDAVAELVELAERLGAAVFHQPMHDRLDFPTDHPLHAGMLPSVNARIREALTEFDVALVVGCRAFMPHHYSAGSPIPAGLRVVQLDSDPAEPGRNLPVELGLVGGVRPSLRGLVEELSRRPVCSGDHGRRQASRLAAQRDQLAREVALATRSAGRAPMSPLAAVHAVAAGLPEDAVVVEEAITAGVLLRSVLRQRRPGSYSHTLGGGLGSGVGRAIGHALGDPARPVVAVLGDGCAMFGLQGLWNAAHDRVPVTFLVMNNGEYRTLKHTLDDARSPASRSVGLDLGPPALDFTHAGAFFGLDTVRAESAGEITEIVAKAGRRETPLLVDVPVTGYREATGRTGEAS